jgi:phospholipid/cholesterol/gamma-HCH transport system substrate-binding protein
MSAYRRNIVVGITVLTSLLVLGWMLLKFGSAPAKLFHNGLQLEVHFVADRSDGLAEGSQVLYRGVPVGRITHLRRDENQQDILIDAEIDDTPPLPGNLHGLIRTQSLLSGSASMSLELIGIPPVVPTGALASGQVMDAKFVGSDLIPQQFGELAAELEKTTHDVRDARLVAHLDETVRSASDVLKSLHDYVADPKMREDFQVSLANFREVTEKTNRAATNVEKFSDGLEKLSDQASATLTKTQSDVDQVNKQLNDRLLQISKLLDTFQSIASKVDTGKGGAGMLLNDPKLYQSLLDSSKELNATVSDLRRLVEQWEQEGVSLKLK